MVKTRRSVNGDAEADEREFSATTTRDRASEEKHVAVAEWSQRELRSNRYRVTRTLQRWPTKLVSRRLRTIKMPRIMFPESDTEPEKYSRRSRPVRVFFEGEAETRRRVRPRQTKNYMEECEDKPIQQNVRRSGRQRKLLHHSFNESWITNELKVKGYPGLYAGLCGGSTSSDDCSLDERRPERRATRTANGTVHTDEDAASNSRVRRTSARCSANKKPHIDASETEGSQETDGVVVRGAEPTVKSEEPQPMSTEEQKKEESELPPDSESNQGPARSMRLRRQRQTATDKKDSQQETASDSETSDSSTDIVLNRAPRRSNRTRKPKPAFVEITKRPTRQAKTYTIRKKPYSLRERKPPKMLRRKTLRSQSPSSSSSTTSSSDTEADLNVSVKNKTKGRQKTKTMGEHSERALREIQPIEVDGSVRFSSVGGLEEHIQCLREMVLFPLMYPELFRKFGTRPARGVLFHGPPGTGKTLLARALANECAQVGGRKVAFFMRKGADCLKKWVGESERHLKLLFQQANNMKPSIIFFDEIDALAPVRSVRQEQVHTSVVGTLLAEVDGICDRGEVIVIGATNRLDAVDPALRRAGRFDRELHFPPPHAAARRDILHMYTREWSPAPHPDTLQHLAHLTGGYGGSDLKALCSEAVLRALRRVYPQVYDSEHALVIDPQKVEVTEADMVEAMGGLVACGARACPPPARALPQHASPLLGAQLRAATEILGGVAPHLLDSKYCSPTLTGGLLLVCGPCADSHIAPALLATLERCTVKELSLATLHSALAFTHEQALISVFAECRRADRGCVLFVRDMAALWRFLGETGVALFTQLWRSGAAGERTLMLCSANVPYKDLPEDCQSLFPSHAECVYGVREPTVTEVIEFLNPLVVRRCLLPPRVDRTEPPPPLPRAASSVFIVPEIPSQKNPPLKNPTLPPPPPPPPRESSEETARRKRAEDYKLRELRIFLRDICRKLAANRRFYKFTKPVDLDEVTDYLDIIKQPMDLETMMTKVDMHRYNCAQEFLQDIDLICANALEYNPDRTSSDKQIRHEACSLRDHAHALIEVEMDSDFEQECRGISLRRRREGAALDPDLPSFIYTTTHLAGDLIAAGEQGKAPSTNGLDKMEATPNSSRKRRRRGTAWSKGFAKRPKTHKSFCKEEPACGVTDEESKENKPVMTSTPLADGSTTEESDAEAERTVRARRADDSELIFNLSSHKSAVLISPPKSSVGSSASKSSPKKRNSGHESSHSDGDKLIINKTELETIVYKNAKHLRTVGLPALLELYGQLSGVVQRYAARHDRSALPADLAALVARYVQPTRK